MAQQRLHSFGVMRYAREVNMNPPSLVQLENRGVFKFVCFKFSM